MIPIVHTLVEAAVMLAGALLAVGLGGPIVTAVFRHADRAEGVAPPALPPGRAGSGEVAPGAVEVSPAPAGVEATPAPASLQGAASVLRGGLWIGRLERLAVFVSLLAGYPNGLAVAVAVKALARYPELKSTTSAAAERFIIGTFVSVLGAVGCAGLARWVVTLL